MLESNELINFILSLLLFVYFIYLIREYAYNVQSHWFIAVMFILLSNVATILEGFFLHVLLNFLEHLFFLLASIFLFIGFLRSFVLTKND